MLVFADLSFTKYDVIDLYLLLCSDATIMFSLSVVEMSQVETFTGTVSDTSPHIRHAVHL